MVAGSGLGPGLFARGPASSFLHPSLHATPRPSLVFPLPAVLPKLLRSPPPHGQYQWRGATCRQRPSHLRGWEDGGECRVALRRSAGRAVPRQGQRGGPSAPRFWGWEQRGRQGRAVQESFPELLGFRSSGGVSSRKQRCPGSDPGRSRQHLSSLGLGSPRSPGWNKARGSKL